MTYVRYFSAAARMLLALTVVLGIAYPVAVWAVGQVAFRHQAQGSMLEMDGEDVGSSLIGQTFEGSEWFHGRPSAGGYDPLATGASNLAADNPKLLKQVERRESAVVTEDSVAPGDVPPDALTASGSGLDPHISPAHARQQVARVAADRGLEVTTVAQLVEDHVQGRLLGFLGEPRVNVLELNLALLELDS